MATLEEVLEIQKQRHILQAPTSSKAAPAFTTATAPTLDIALENTTDSSNCWAYVTGLDINKNNTVFILQSDGVTPYYPASPGDVGSPLQQDCHIKLGAPGSTTQVTIPQLAGGRIWLCRDSQLRFLLNPGPAVVEPSVTNPSDPNYNLYWSFVEFTFNDFQLFANITYVDFVGMAISMTLENQSGQIQSVPGIPADGLATVCSMLQDQDAKDGAGWSKLIIKHPSTGADLRALSPNSGIVMDSSLFEGYYQPYVDAVWAKYSSDTLMVDTQNQWGIVNGQVTNGELTFADVGSYAQPSARDIFACNSGPFADRADDSNKEEMGNITARLAAAFNRSTLLVNPRQPDGEAVATYYADPVTNHYSRAVHEVAGAGKGYAFPYDDVAPTDDANVAGTVSDTDPKLWTVSFGGGGVAATSSARRTSRVSVSQIARSGGSGRQHVGSGLSRRDPIELSATTAEDEKTALAGRDDAANTDLEKGLAKLLLAAADKPNITDADAETPQRHHPVRALLRRFGLGLGTTRAPRRPALDALVAAAAELIRVAVRSAVGRAVVVAVLVLGSFVLGVFWPGGGEIGAGAGGVVGGGLGG
ncbi:hypothetical protein QBC33DRAFT_513442 [Phialemonium atrogriseum]|uniref:GH64 domain-containing protein n=1 Tax=Phialemonium atrogriseum TaxID=1093897 RepID=A0AAJ0FIU4_9PEZI|nr:uncharacterized protein QBC33DRAFT_513442 [Phialemonium atrogriseum]KAK1769212.1 hypothetical protein QBC33DRAFT_513442 [Phialemonium atrogriseum]